MAQNTFHVPDKQFISCSTNFFFVQDDYVGPKGGDPADSETEVERPQRRKRGRPPGKGRGVGVRKKGPGTGTKKPLHKSKLIEQNLKVISHEEYEKALRKYSSNVIVGKFTKKKLTLFD